VEGSLVKGDGWWEKVQFCNENRVEGGTRLRLFHDFTVHLAFTCINTTLGSNQSS
jgi:hypothetical protein